MTAGTPHQALYRRWRAQTFSEMVGQEAVVATLRNAVATGKVSHGLLFTGPRGTGKTSLARIVAKAINCENLGPTADPCDTCRSCVAIREGNALDLVEIDAASNRGIESIRELRERLSYAPTDLRRKVYILDEAHQITRDAWNALLKSLEEPPDFVTFMFASTHPQEFPPAILSRLQRFDVRRLTVSEISGKLERILEADGREAEPEAVALIARLAAGGMRDAESILDQLLASTDGGIRAEAVRDLLGLADADLVETFVGALAGRDVATGIGVLDRLEERGRDLRIFLDQVVDALRDRLVAGMSDGGGVDAGLAAGARRLASIDPTRLGAGGLRLQLELALFETPSSAPGAATPVKPIPAASTPAAPVPAQDPTARPRRAPPSDAADGVAEPPAADRQPAPAAPPIVPGVEGDDLDRLRHGWLEVVTAISASPSLKPLILECRPVTVEGNVVTLGFPEEKPFMREAAERKRGPIEAQIATLLGHEVSVRCVVSNLDLLPPLPADADAAHILAEAQRIFGEDLAEVPEVS